MYAAASLLLKTVTSQWERHEVFSEEVQVSLRTLGRHTANIHHNRLEDRFGLPEEIQPRRRREALVPHRLCVNPCGSQLCLTPAPSGRTPLLSMLIFTAYVEFNTPALAAA